MGLYHVYRLVIEHLEAVKLGALFFVTWVGAGFLAVLFRPPGDQ